MDEFNLPECPEAREAVLSISPVTREGGDATVRAKILHMEQEMKKLPDQIDLPLKHFFAPGVYAREIFLPKGSVVTGKIHKHAHLNIISRGKVSVVTEFGPMVIDATVRPYTFTSQAGTKRALYVDEDAIWTTIHLTNETDLTKIEDEIIAPTYDDLALPAPDEQLKIEGETP
jgi:hypothetical protein